MQSSSPLIDISNILLGERRGKADLERSSLELSWARAATDCARSRAYPSPPMSGTPPIPPRHNPESSDRSHGSYGSSGQDVYRGTKPSRSEPQENMAQPVRVYPAEQAPQTFFTPFRTEMPAGQLQYQQQAAFMIPQQQQQQQQPFPQHPHQMSAAFSTPESALTREGPDFTSPKNQRKTKGHVVSACVPCKKAHLRCDAQRPCSRCMSNGKEETCVDVQHKKRGRPRLRDERESRYDNMASGYTHPPEASMRRPVSYYGPATGSSEGPVGPPFGDSLHRSGSYRVLKSQGQGPSQISGSIAPRFVDHALQEANVYGSMQSVPRTMVQEPICAYLNMDMQFVKATQSFVETVGIQVIVSRKLQEIVVPNDFDKVMRQQRAFDEERREKEPNYLPPIYLKVEEERVIQSIGFGPEDLGQVRIEKQETLTFQGPHGQTRSFQARLGLGKRELTYFVVMILYPQQQQNVYQHPPPSQYSREVYPRDQQYSFQPSPQQQQYMQHSSPSSYSPASGFDSPMNYRPQGHMGSNAPNASNIQGYAQSPRQEYAPPQAQYQPPPPQAHQQYQPPSHVEMHSGQVQRQRDLQLPPIRDQRGEISADPVRRRDDRSGRVDIGGLIEKPGIVRRGER